MNQTQHDLYAYRRIVIKIGSALLVHPQNGLKQTWLKSLIEDIAALLHKGVEILLVSSGAIALGRTIQGLPKGPLKLEQSQACAALGQIALAKAYNDALLPLSRPVGQILLTLADTEERRRYLNARATINTLINFGAIPVINENDTVATSEIRYGDNDRLAARVATMVEADLLILLSDIDGLYSAAPHLDKNARFIPYIESITADIEQMAGGSASEFARGGMKTKLDAGKIATAAGVAMIITSGQREHPLRALMQGERASFFAPARQAGSAWKTWISGNLAPAGRLVIDSGALKALQLGKSLLAVGVVAVEGQFKRGDTVAIIAPNGQEIGRGLSNYHHEDAKKIIGCKSAEIAPILGYPPRAAMIHRNDMALI